MKTYEEGIIKGFSHNINVVEELETKLDNANLTIKELSNRILKAIEYINQHYPVCAGSELLEILKGSDK